MYIYIENVSCNNCRVFPVFVFIFYEHVRLNERTIEAAKHKKRSVKKLKTALQAINTVNGMACVSVDSNTI